MQVFVISRCAPEYAQHSFSDNAARHPLQVTWASDGDVDAAWDEKDQIIDAASLKLSDGTDASPLVWANQLRNALGQPLKSTGLRIINRTETYRCKDVSVRK